jgi:hypothetical protein
MEEDDDEEEEVGGGGNAGAAEAKAAERKKVAGVLRPGWTVQRASNGQPFCSCTRAARRAVYARGCTRIIPLCATCT